MLSLHDERHGLHAVWILVTMPLEQNRLVALLKALLDVGEGMGAVDAVRVPLAVELHALTLERIALLGLVAHQHLVCQSRN